MTTLQTSVQYREPLYDEQWVFLLHDLLKHQLILYVSRSNSSSPATFSLSKS